MRSASSSWHARFRGADADRNRRHGTTVVAVYTREPKPAGRGMALTPSPVGTRARRFGIPGQSPKTLRTPGIGKRLSGASGRRGGGGCLWLILPKPILDAVPLGCFTCMLRYCRLARRCPRSTAPSWRATPETA